MSIPSYHAWLTYYHRAFAKELQKMVSDLPICAGDRVLDVGCGDGSFTQWLAPLVAPQGEVIALDIAAHLVKSARQRFRRHEHRRLMHFVHGDVNALPFPERYFDVVWCAQNLFSFPDIRKALLEMVRVLKPGGVLAILENDSLHQILLPWPIEFELDLLRAEYHSFREKNELPHKFYIARELRGLLRSVGIHPQRKKVYASQREVPFTKEELEFLKLYLEGLKKRTEKILLAKHKKGILDILNPKSARYILNEPELTLTCIDQVAWGKKYD